MAQTSVSSSTSDAQLVAADSSRKGLVVVNDDANRLYVLLGSSTSSATSYSFSLAQHENAFVPGYTGEVRGIWEADGSGAARITTF